MLYVNSICINQTSQFKQDGTHGQFYEEFNKFLVLMCISAMENANSFVQDLI